jgi:hypothetical protein
VSISGVLCVLPQCKCVFWGLRSFFDEVRDDLQVLLKSVGVWEWKMDKWVGSEAKEVFFESS